MSKKSQLTNHRARLTRAAWAAKERIEAAGFRDPHTNRPLKGTQAIVEFALVQFEGSSKEATRYLEHNKRLVDEQDTLRQQIADQKLSIERLEEQSASLRAAATKAEQLEKDLNISRKLCTSLEQDREERDRLKRLRTELDEKNNRLVAEIQKLNVLLAEKKGRVRDLTAQVEKGTQALQDCKASMESSRQTWVANERLLRQRNDTLKKELDEAKQGDPRWLAAGFLGFALGAAAMLLLRLWGV